MRACLGFRLPSWLGLLEIGIPSWLFRRCLSSVVDDLFAFGSSPDDGFADEIRPLPRKICSELVLLAALSPLMCSNLAVDYLDVAVASDASLAKGAVVRAPILPEVCEELWLDSDKKGHYVTLENGAREFLKHLGEPIEEDLPVPLIRPKASPSFTLTLWNCAEGWGLLQRQLMSLDLLLHRRWTYRHLGTTI